MAPLPESMIGYSQKLDLLSSIYNVRLDKDKNNKCVKKVKKSNTQANRTSSAKCKENCRGVTKTAETRIQKNGPQLKESQDPIYHKSKPLKGVQPSGSSTTPANVTTRTQTVIKTPLKTKTALNKNPFVKPSDLLQKTQPMKAQKSTTTVLKKNTCVVPSDTFEANMPNEAHKSIANVVSKNHFVVPSDSHQRTKPIKTERSNTNFVNKKGLVKPSDTLKMAHPIKAQKSTTTVLKKNTCVVPSDTFEANMPNEAHKSIANVVSKNHFVVPSDSHQRTKPIKAERSNTNFVNKKGLVKPSDTLKMAHPIKAQKSTTTVLKKNTCVVPSDTFEANMPNEAHKSIANVVSKNHFVVPSDSHQRTKPIKAERSNTNFVNKKGLVKPSDTLKLAHPIEAQKSTTTVPSKKLCAVPSDSLQMTRLTRAQASTSNIPNKKPCLEPLRSLQMNHSSKVQKCATNGLNKKALVVPLDSLKRNQAVRAQKSKAIVLNEKPTEQLKQQSSQKKTSGVNPYAAKNISDSQPRKKVSNNNLKSEWRNFERILQSDIYTLQELYKTDVNSVFDFGADMLNKLEEAPGGTAVQKMEWKSRIYYYFMKAYSAAGDQNSALEFSSLLLRFARTTKDGELLYNTYNITAKVYVKLEDYHTAIVLWEKMIKLTENLADQAYILHEIGRCYYALSEWSEANMYGQQSLSAAKGCDNRQWCKNANLLIGQAEIRLKDPKRALQAFEEAELYALTLDDEGLLSYIEAQKKLLQNVTETKCQ